MRASLSEIAPTLAIVLRCPLPRITMYVFTPVEVMRTPSGCSQYVLRPVAGGRRALMVMSVRRWGTGGHLNGWVVAVSGVAPRTRKNKRSHVDVDTMEDGGEQRIRRKILLTVI